VRSQAGRLILAAFALAAGCATALPPPTRLYVHVDTLHPDKIDQFEQARVRFVQLLRERRTSDRRGLYLKIGGGTYYSVVSFGAFADLDRLRAERVRAVQPIKNAVDEYDRLSDESLVFPHASEIWSAEPALSYLPTGMRLEDALELVIEDIKPTADYEAAWKPIAAALLQAKFPVERRSYFSAYGSGRTLSFWLAPSRAVLKAAPTLQQALVAAVGETRAEELLRAWRDCVLHQQTLDVEARPDMTSY
jgi:hypothetical protein